MVDSKSPKVIDKLQRSPSRAVLVSFDPSDGWTFAPPFPVIEGPGNIIFLREPSNAPWAFTRFDVENHTKQFAVTVQPDRCIVRDDWKVAGSFKFVCTVQQGGDSFQSPDPEIINTGPP